MATGTLFALSWLHRQIRISFEHGFRHHATLSLAADGFELVYTYDGRQEEEGRGISTLLTQLEQAGISFKDLHTRQSSLEDIFVDLVKERS